MIRSNWLQRNAREASRALAARVNPRSPTRRQVERWIVVPILDLLARTRLRWNETIRGRSRVAGLEARLRRAARYDWKRPGRPGQAPNPGAIPRVLFVLHDAEGGVYTPNRDELSSIHDRFEAFLLTATPARLKLYRYSPHGVDPLKTWWLRDRWSHQLKRSHEHREIYRTVMSRLGVDLVHIRHLLGHTEDLIAVCSELGIPTVLSFHDFYLACPTIHLIDDRGHYCTGHCTPTREQCRIPVDWLEDLPVLKQGYLEQWRARVQGILPEISVFVTTSQSTRDLLVDLYPELADRDFRVIEHGRSFPRQLHLAEVPKPDGPIRIVAAGHLHYHKGSDFIRRLKEYDRSHEDLLEFHFLGTIDEHLRGVGTEHGPYSRDRHASRVEVIRPGCFAIFSVWPETYCHTLTEAWSMGVPVFGSELGAVGDRLQAHGGGWTVPVDDVDGAYRKIVQVVRSPEHFDHGAGTACLRYVRPVTEMAKDYEEIYLLLLTENRRIAAAERP